MTIWFYTTEVLGNIKESYPLPLLVSGILFADILLTYLVVKKKLLVGSLASKSIVKSRLKTGLVLLCIPALSFILIKNTTIEITKNRYNNELAKNGIHSLFAAFLNSELDYDLFYAVRDNQENFKQLRSLLKSENSQYLSNEPLDITREINQFRRRKTLQCGIYHG